jgi:hypothetical protein
MVIKTGEYEVYSSGTIISYEAEPISFIIADDFIIRIVFEDLDTDSEPEMKMSNVRNVQVYITLINFNKQTASGNKVPLYLGYEKGRKMYLNFRVEALGTSLSRTLYYTWYARELITEAEKIS